MIIRWTDSELSNSLCIHAMPHQQGHHACFYHLIRLRKIRNITQEVMALAVGTTPFVTSLVISRLDYCNSVRARRRPSRI